MNPSTQRAVTGIQKKPAAKAKVGFGKVDRVPPNAGGGKHKRVVAETAFEDGEKERFERLGALQTMGDKSKDTGITLPPQQPGIRHRETHEPKSCARHPGWETTGDK